MLIGGTLNFGILTPKEKRMRRVFCLAVLAFLCSAAVSAAAISGAEKVVVAKQITDPQSAEAAATASALMENVTALSNRLFAGRLEITTDAAKARYSLSLILSLKQESPSAILSLAAVSDPEKSVTYAYLGVLAPEVPAILAHALFLLWNNIRGSVDQGMEEPPVFVDELPAGLISTMATPMSAAMSGDGSLVVGLVTTCVQMDSAFKVLDRLGTGLYDAGNYSYAYGVSATPGGTIYLKPSMGRDAYKLPPGVKEPQKVSLGMELPTASITALADGSLFVLDPTQKKAFRLQGRKRLDFKIFATDWSYISAVASAPDGSLWFYDPYLKGVRIFTLEGTPVDAILPSVDLSSSLSPYAMAVGPDGSFIVLANTQIVKFRRDGSVVWRIKAFDGADLSNLPSYGGVAVDWSRGLIYVTDASGRRIVKLVDRAYCRQKGITNAMEDKVIALREGRAQDEAGSYAKAAQLYTEAGSTLMAKAYWQKVDEADPGNPEAATELLAIEVDELKAAAHELDAKARATLASIGLESARPFSVQAIQKYELILSKAPGDQQARKDMTDLKDLFSDNGPAPERKKPIDVGGLRLANLFPSLMEWYAAHPAGSVTVKNTLTEPVQNLRASLLIPRFMDLPTQSKAVPRLEPGQSVTLDLSPGFNQKVLELQEDMGIQAQVTVTYTAGALEQTVTQMVGATIYRNTALTWDDTRRISSFITPNEDTVSGFAARVLASSSPAAGLRFSRSITQAMRICDAVGTYGITYVPDPDSPFSKALGKAEIVDTVRFPRTTLYNKTGDCDDTTALLGSLLESAGIHTAVLTTPGHIFLAFDSGEPAQNAWYLSGKTLEAISRNGSAWIPVETTFLSQGFMAAWASASELVRRYAAAGPFDLIPLADMRDIYPALPLPPSTITVPDPAPAGVDKAVAASLAGFTATLYTGKLKELDLSLASLSGKQAIKVRVQEGVLHALFGRMADAEAAFRKVIADAPTMVSPYVNLANVRLLANDGDGALTVVKQGLAKAGDSVLLDLLAARIYFDRGDASNSSVYFAKVKKEAPEIAARYPELGASGGTARAAQAGERPVMIWGED
jgi:tetratricopeptide (TPR) repeat protein